MAINFNDLKQLFSSDSGDTNKPKLPVTLPNILKLIYQDSTEKSGPWIAGGMGRQIVIGESNFNDIDVWFKDKEQFIKIQSRLLDTFGYEIWEKFASDNAMTYRAGDHTIQLIKRKWYPSLEAVFTDFDFTCCQVAINDDMTAYGPGVDDAKNKILKLNRFDNKAFLARYAKYVGYGYTMNPDEFIQIIENNTINYDFDGTTLGY
jgi:hypothetical protein